MPEKTPATGRPGRPSRGAPHRLDLKRAKASTSVRLPDRHLALLHKLALKRKIPLSEALELVIDTASTELKVKVRSSPNSDLGWA